MTMEDPPIVEMMSRGALLWRCLHRGPLTPASIDQPDQEGKIPWAEFRGRNLRFIENLADTYGSCAVVARSGDRIIGHLRFYPKIVFDPLQSGRGMCLQQEPPWGPDWNLKHRRFPPLEEIEDKSLVVHCMMVNSIGPGGESLRRKGIGTRMARTLIDWAAGKGWRAIESTAYESLPIIYSISGQTGRSFWEDLGFRPVKTEIEPALEEENDFVRNMREEARTQGLDPERITNKYTMRLVLS